MIFSMINARTAAITLVGLALAVARPSGPVVVGVLEHPECERTDTVAVRALFAKTDADWMALDSQARFERLIAREMSWTVAFDGKSLGAIRTIDRRPGARSDWTLDHDGVLELAPGERAPHRANPGDRFDGSCNPSPARPLVVVSRPHFGDPEAWKPFSPGAAVLDSLLPVFRAAVDSVFLCPGDAEDFANATRFRFTARDLRIVRAYRNRAGRTIVGIEFADMKPLCNEPTSDSYSTHWFQTGKAPMLIGAGFQLVDAGDYDADGKSELVFAYNGYNCYGYTLFTSGFGKRVDVRWTDH